jgi:tetratricopeptide (TPR) repeat protein
MLGASAFFAYKIYEHVQTLQDPEDQEAQGETTSHRTAAAFSTFDASSLLEKADQERESGNLDKALAIYSEANIKEPKNEETLFKMGYTLVLQEREDEALEYFMESLEIDDQNPFTYQEIAKIYEKKGKTTEAEKFYSRAKDLDENI